jgi:hypothetical protein
MSLVPVAPKAPGPLAGIVNGVKGVANLAGVFSAVGNMKKNKNKTPTPQEAFSGAGISSGTEWGVRNADYTVSLVRTGSKSGQSGHVIAHIPETIDLNITADYNQPYAELALGSPILQAIGKSFGLKVSSNAFSMQVWEGSSPIELTIPFKFVAVRDSYEEVIKPIRELSRFCLPTVVTPDTGGGFIQFGIIKSPGPNLLFNGASLFDNAAKGVSGATKVIKKTTGAVADDIGDNNYAKGAVDIVTGVATAAATFVNNMLAGISVENNISLHIGRFCRLRSVVVKSVSQAYNTRFDIDGQMIEATVNVSIATFVNPTSADVNEVIGWRAVQQEETETDLVSSSAAGSAPAVGAPIEDRISQMQKDMALFDDREPPVPPRDFVTKVGE